jgi:hypothetical protein
LRGRERDSDDHDRNQELAIESWSVIGDRLWQPPFSIEEKEH